MRQTTVFLEDQNFKLSKKVLKLEQHLKEEKKSHHAAIERLRKEVKDLESANEQANLEKVSLEERIARLNAYKEQAKAAERKSYFPERRCCAIFSNAQGLSCDTSGELRDTRSRLAQSLINIDELSKQLQSLHDTSNRREKEYAAVKMVLSNLPNIHLNT